MRRAIGDLVTCSYCSGPWVALGLVAAYLESPGLGRTVAGMFTAVAVSDWLHRGYEKLGEEERGEGQPGEEREEWSESHLEVHPDDVQPDQIG